MSSSSRKLLQAAAGVGGDFYDYKIENSCRFDGSSALTRTPSSNGSGTIWTFSTWIKFANPETAFDTIFGAGTAGSGYYWTGIFYSSSGVLTAFYDYPYPTQYYIRPSARLRDTSAWYHIVCVHDTTQATASDRYKLYLNGVRYTTGWDFTDYPPQNYVSNVNSTSKLHMIGGYPQFPSSDSTYRLNGYLAETHFCDGTAYDASYFGEFKNGIWVPKEPSVSYGTNGFYFDYADSSNLGNDVSGNNNDYTSIGLTSSDQMLDTPTNTFPTFDPLTISSGYRSVLSNGNLYAAHPTTGAGMAPATIAFPSQGLFWLECRITGTSSPRYNMTGLSDKYYIDPYADSSANEFYWNPQDGYIYVDNSATAVQPGTYTSGDIIGYLVDTDNQQITFYKNGTSTGVTFNFNAAGCRFFASDGTNSPVYTWQSEVNFGQGGTYSRGYSDANDIGNFYYQPPTGALALCTANLPEPTIGPNSATTSDEHFDTALYTGNGGTTTVSSLNFQPDLTWIKSRTYARYHALADVLRGSTNFLTSNETSAEDTVDSGNGVVWNSTGFEVDASSDWNSLNESGANIVAWNWKGNGSGVTNNDGSITSTVSANQDAGFSIISATSPASGNFTVGHGLTQAPEFVAVKDRNNVLYWAVYHSAVMTSVRNYMVLNDTRALSTSGGDMWGSAFPTSSVIGLSAGNAAAASSPFICYAFHSVEGFSKFGSFSGNGLSNDGPFVHTGFRPAFLMLKRTDSTSNWTIIDAKRNTYNVVTNYLDPNVADAERTDFNWADFTSNGFKVIGTNTAWNVSGGSYIYMAFAESPFKYSNAR